MARAMKYVAPQRKASIASECRQQDRSLATGSPQYQHTAAIGAEHALPARGKLAASLAPHVTERIRKLPRVRAGTDTDLFAIELGRAARDEPATTIEALFNLRSHTSGTFVIAHGEQRDALTAETGQLGREIVRAGRAQGCEPTIGVERPGEVVRLAKDPCESQQGSCAHRLLTMINELSVLVRGRGQLLLTELDYLDAVEHTKRRRAVVRGGDEGEPTLGRHDDPVWPGREDHGRIDRWEGSYGACEPAAQPLAGFGELAADGGRDEVRALLDLFADALLVHGALLHDQPPPEPAERRRHHHRRGQKRHQQRVRSAEHCIGILLVRIPVSVSDLSGFGQREGSSSTRQPQLLVHHHHQRDELRA
jgi:hypothetical protein